MQPMQKSYKLLVAGEWIEDSSTLPVIDKYTGEVIGECPGGIPRHGGKGHIRRSCGFSKLLEDPGAHAVSHPGEERLNFWTNTRKRSPR